MLLRVRRDRSWAGRAGQAGGCRHLRSCSAQKTSERDSVGASLGDPEPSRSLFTHGGLGRILKGEAILGWVQEPAEEIGETLKNRVVGAWTWGWEAFLGWGAQQN